MGSANHSTVVEKKDLHVGGVGTNVSGALAGIAEPMVNGADTWVRRARYAARNADDYVRDRPWQAIGVVALLALAVGYLVSRRS
jgi:ElaB protein